MIKWRSWWLDVLLAGLLALGVASAMGQTDVLWPQAVVGLALFAGGYGLVRPRLRLIDGPPAHWLDALGVVVLIGGLSLAVCAWGAFAICLFVACPVVWMAIRGYIPALVGNIALVAAVTLASGLRSWNEGTLAQDWRLLLGSAVLVTAFTIVMGTMVNAATRWGEEREALLEELRASEADLAESYRQLLADTAIGTAPVDSPLSARETEVLELVARGYTNRDISRRLFISPATVKTHMEHVLAKLGATTRTQAVLLAHRAGLLRAADTDGLGPTWTEAARESR